MVYVDFPIWARTGERIALVIRYLPFVALGLVGALIPSRSSVPPVSVIVSLAAIACLVGAVTRRYHIEWLGISVLAVAMSVAITIQAAAGHHSMLWLSVALACSLGDRWVRLARESWLAREELRVGTGEPRE